MLPSYLSTAYRSMLRNKTATFISIGGLALGMCCSLLILIYVQFELSHDAFHKNRDLIYQIQVKGITPQGTMEYRSSVPHELAEKIRTRSISQGSLSAPDHENDSDSRMQNSDIIASNDDDFPHSREEKELELLKKMGIHLYQRYTLMSPGSDFITEIVRMAHQEGHVQYKNRIFEEKLLYFTDSAVLKMFDFPLQTGDSKTALSSPGSIVLSSETAKKYFAQEEPLGKEIRLEIPFSPPMSFTVTGVLQPIPKNSSMQIHCLAAFPFDELKRIVSGRYPLYTYTYVSFGGVKREPRSSIFQTLVRDLIIQYVPIPVATVANYFNRELKTIRVSDTYADERYTEWHFCADPFRRAYFAKDRIFTSFTGKHGAPMKKGNRLTLLLLFVLALLILVISSVNVINLSTARSAGRAREIAVRKMMGADRRRLIVQFLTESILLSVISLLLSLSMVEILLPGFNHILHLELTPDDIYNWGYLGTMIGVAVMAGFFSGIYPAFYLSSFPALDTIKGENLPQSKKFRKWLMSFQLTASILILIFSCFLSREFRFLRNTVSGLKAKQIVFFKIDDENLGMRYPTLKQKLIKVPGVSRVAASSLAAWEYGTSEVSSFSAEVPVSISLPPIPASIVTVTKTVQARLMLVDQDFLTLYDIPITTGENFPAALEKSIPDNRDPHPSVSPSLPSPVDFSSDTHSKERSTSQSHVPNRFCIINTETQNRFYPAKIVGKILSHQLHANNGDVGRTAPVNHDIPGAENQWCKVIGVSENFHYHYPWQMIDPLVMILDDRFIGIRRSYISVRLLPEDKNETKQTMEIVRIMVEIEKTVKEFFPDNLFTYHHVEREMDRILEENAHLERILAIASGITIFLSALGIAGFAEYEAGRKRKEIGIRKALGATRTRICIRFVRQFIPMVLTTNIMAWGIALLTIPILLSKIDYPYPFHMGGSIFTFSFSVTLLVTVSAAGFRIFQAASVNPSDALRDE